jgi:hypothetical protein
VSGMMPFAGMHELVEGNAPARAQERSGQLRATIVTLHHELRTRCALQDPDKPVTTSATSERNEAEQERAISGNNRNNTMRGCLPLRGA